MPSSLYNLNSKYGTEEELIACVKELQSHGFKVLGDAVLNHRCAQRLGRRRRGIVMLGSGHDAL